jgi:hypothetical protein
MIMITESWYKNLESKYGYDFCVRAGYFEETKPWGESSYRDIFELPSGEFVIQYSGAFYPLHDGHLEVMQKAMDNIIERWDTSGVVVIHVDHHEYRTSKGKYSEEEFNKSLAKLDTLFPYKGFTYQIIAEDAMPNGCSRNFTRLYSELSDKSLYNTVYFLCGSDRANYAFTFLDDGNCYIVNRPNTINPLLATMEVSVFENLGAYANETIIYLDCNNPTSSTEIRNLTTVL